MYNLDSDKHPIILHAKITQTNDTSAFSIVQLKPVCATETCVCVYFLNTPGLYTTLHALNT